MSDKTTSKDNETEKRPYSAPQLVRVVLRPEEAVLGACKNGVDAGPSGVTCAVSGCATSGS